MMNREIVISLIAGAAVMVVFYILLTQDQTTPQSYSIRETVRTDTLRLAPDTIFLPGTLTATLLPEYDALSPSYRILCDSLAALREQLTCTLQLLAELSTVRVRGDSILTRSALLVRNSVRHTILFQDTLGVEYTFPPENHFTITHREVRFALPSDTVIAIEYHSRPLWADILIGIVGAAISWLVSH